MNTIQWTGVSALILDQTRLPAEEVFLEIGDYRGMIEAIKSLRIRGAPAIGVAAAYGIVLGVRAIEQSDLVEFLEQFEVIVDEIVESRPTAVNIAWAAARMRTAAATGVSVKEVAQTLETEAARILSEDVAVNRAMGRHGSMLIPARCTVMTHCNAGSLATVDYGTAIGVLRAAKEQGKEVSVMATETRPLLQGSRLTAWELQRDGFPTTLITDSMAGHFLNSGLIDCVVVGADRIAMNGDVANKIGTYTLAVLAHENQVPFYVAAPTSTVDPELVTGDGVLIEQRSPEEVTSFGGVPSAPDGIAVANPAFDVTPHRYVTAIITELGIARAPYSESLNVIMESRTNGDAHSG